jgi:RNase P subunit RPR2
MQYELNDLKKIVCRLVGHRLVSVEQTRVRMSSYNMIVYSHQCSRCGGILKNELGQNVLTTVNEPFKKNTE